METKTLKQQIQLVLRLSMPAILAEISSIVMQYIDASMVGSMGAGASASIGLVASSTWLIGGLCISVSTGFSVQIAQLIGAKKEKEARNVMRQGLLTAVLFSLVLSLAGIWLSPYLPVWLGGQTEIVENAAAYFMIYSCSLPALQLRHFAGSVLQCSGDMKTPSIWNTVMCLLDVVFNAVLIFQGRTVSLAGGGSVFLYGAGLGVTGAALGTALAELVTAAVLMWCLLARSKQLRLRHRGSWRLSRSCLRNAVKIGVPMAFEHSVMCGAQVMGTKIVAPLGTIAVAANSLGVTAESFCYMPGYGLAAAATTLVGQSIGAGNKKQAVHFARITTLLGTLLMTVMAVAMYFLAPFAFGMLTSDAAVQQLGIRVLRIEMLAEPFYAISIVAAGALRGAGDTLVPSLLNLFSMWGIRITASLLLAPHFGLVGVWIAMCAELMIRGILFLVRLMRGRWADRQLAS